MIVSTVYALFNVLALTISPCMPYIPNCIRSRFWSLRLQDICPWCGTLFCSISCRSVLLHIFLFVSGGGGTLMFNMRKPDWVAFWGWNSLIKGNFRDIWSGGYENWVFFPSVQLLCVCFLFYHAWDFFFLFLMLSSRLNSRIVLSALMQFCWKLRTAWKLFQARFLEHFIYSSSSCDGIRIKPSGAVGSLLACIACFACIPGSFCLSSLIWARCFVATLPIFSWPNIRQNEGQLASYQDSSISQLVWWPSWLN